MDREELLKIYHAEEIKMLLDRLSVKSFCHLCSISTVYYYRIIKTTTRYELYKKYCG